MRKLKKEKKEFNKGYIPVIISSLVLLVLIVGLIIIVVLEPADNKDVIVIDEDGKAGLSENDVLFDNSKISCKKDTYKSLSEKAGNIDIVISYALVESEETYEDLAGVYEGPIHDYYDGFDIEFKGLDDSITLELTGNDGKVNETIDSKNNHYITAVSQKIVEYTVVVRGTKDCKNDILRKFTFKTPLFNIVSTYQKCDEIDSKACELFTYEELSVNDILNVESKEKKEQKGEITEEEKKSIVKYVLLIVFLVLVIGSVIVIYVRHRKLVNIK